MSCRAQIGKEMRKRLVAFNAIKNTASPFQYLLCLSTQSDDQWANETIGQALLVAGACFVFTLCALRTDRHYTLETGPNQFCSRKSPSRSQLCESSNKSFSRNVHFWTYFLIGVASGHFICGQWPNCDALLSCIWCLCAFGRRACPRLADYCSQLRS